MAGGEGGESDWEAKRSPVETSDDMGGEAKDEVGGVTFACGPAAVRLRWSGPPPVAPPVRPPPPSPGGLPLPPTPPDVPRTTIPPRPTLACAVDPELSIADLPGGGPWLTPGERRWPERPLAALIPFSVGRCGWVPVWS